jgi:hypothetical protein
MGAENVKTYTVDEFHAEMKAQGVKAREDVAFKCVMCGTVQSVRSLLDAGVDAAHAEKYIGFSCEGRWRGAKPTFKNKKRANPKVRGCDWTLGGLFKLHEVEVTLPDGRPQPTFALASPQEAQALERLFARETVTP